MEQNERLAFPDGNCNHPKKTVAFNLTSTLQKKNLQPSNLTSTTNFKDVKMSHLNLGHIPRQSILEDVRHREGGSTVNAQSYLGIF